tara:strand:+ start:217 stop:324 length:108 start_codon:yes stop_codon:yes gene_type:complete
MPYGSPALLKSRKLLHMDQAKKFWEEVSVYGVEQV